MTTRHCPRCQKDWLLEEFTGRTGYCRSCMAAYRRERLAAIADGTWKPRVARTPAERRARRLEQAQQWLAKHREEARKTNRESQRRRRKG